MPQKKESAGRCIVVAMISRIYETVFWQQCPLVHPPPTVAAGGAWWPRKCSEAGKNFGRALINCTVAARETMGTRLHAHPARSSAAFLLPPACLQQVQLAFFLQLQDGPAYGRPVRRI